MNHSLRWGQPDTLSLLKSDFVHNSVAEPHESPDITSPVSSVIPLYFSSETPSQCISTIGLIPVNLFLSKAVNLSWAYM